MGFTIFSHDEDNETGRTLCTCLKVSGDDDDDGEDYGLRAI